MNAYPPELHSYICSLSCTDDGYTARSLSLVSRYFAQIALPYLYQSVCVSTPAQIRALARRLEVTPKHLRRIHHLFISDSPDESRVGGERELVASIACILTFASPTLETLAFIASSPLTSSSLISRLFRTKFPRLHELTISGYYPFPSSSSSANFPSLERLHLHGNRNPHGLLALGGLESAMPNLTHLRVSGLGLAVSFSEELLSASIVVSEEEDGECMFPLRLPPKLRHLTVQCGPEPSPTSSGRGRPSSAIARRKDATMIDNFEMLQSLSQHHQVRFSLLPRRSAHDISSEELRKDWVERLRGKEGCWTL